MKHLVILFSLSLANLSVASDPAPRKVLFFDLWKLDSWQNLELRQGEPTWIQECEYRDPSFPDGGVYFPSVWIDQASGQWRMVYSVKWSPLTLMFATSQDGISWKPQKVDNSDGNLERLAPNHVLSVPSGSGGGIYHDPMKTDGYAFRIFGRQSGKPVLERALQDPEHHWHHIAKSEGEKRYIEEGNIYSLEMAHHFLDAHDMWLLKDGKPLPARPRFDF